MSEISSVRLAEPFEDILNTHTKPVLQVTVEELDELTDAMDIDPIKERFRITDDQQAEWALGKIREAQLERDRLVALADSEQERIAAEREKAINKYESDTGYFNSLLSEYFDAVPHQVTKAKTKETYALLSGTLVLKHKKPEIVPDKAALIKQFQADGNTEYIKNTPTLQWAELKKRLEIVDGNVVNSETGEIVENVSVTELSSQFVVELR